jgi:glucokinase
MADTVVALDVGGTTIKSAVVSAAGEVLIARRWPTPCEEGPDAVVAAVEAAALETVDLARFTFGAAPSAVGVASLGLVDTGAGVAVLSSNVGWSNVPLVQIVAARVDLPVVLVHDIAAAAVAEATQLSIKSRTNFLFVAIGTGVGGTPVVGGEPVRGAHGRAGEIGHIPVRGATDACGCGQTGCLETVASGRAIARAYRARTHNDAPTTAAHVAAAAARGDSAAAEVWSHACEALAEGLAMYSILMDPQVVVLGGGLSLAGQQLLDPVRDGIATRLPMPGVPEVVAARFGDQAAILGAAIAAQRLLAANRSPSWPSATSSTAGSP